MLILSRKLNESIVIDGRIIVKILRIERDTVKIGIQAPAELPVHRQEVFDMIQKNKQASLNAGTETRATVLRKVTEQEELGLKEFNRAFVLMQYFGYLRRNPNDTPDADFSGFTFWLNKLNTFNGDFRAAEMVKAFITSLEYRKRFGLN